MLFRSEFDASSDEVVTQLVVQFHNVDPEILNQLVIVGALNEGGGRWTVIDEENFSIKAPSGLDLTPNDDSDDGDNGGLSQIGLTIYAEVNDLGEDAVEKDATVVRETDVTLEFPTVLTPQTSVAAEIQVADDVQIEASEDNAIDLGTQLTSKVDAINADGVEDVLTVVIDPSRPVYNYQDLYRQLKINKEKLIKLLIIYILKKGFTLKLKTFVNQ